VQQAMAIGVGDAAARGHVTQYSASLRILFAPAPRRTQRRGYHEKSAGLEEYTHLDGTPRPFKAARVHRCRGPLLAGAESAKASKWARLARQGHQVA
jgi:hypothetical protein